MSAGLLSGRLDSGNGVVGGQRAGTWPTTNPARRRGRADAAVAADGAVKYRRGVTDIRRRHHRRRRPAPRLGLRPSARPSVYRVAQIKIPQHLTCDILATPQNFTTKFTRHQFSTNQ